MKTEWDYTHLADAYLERPDYAPQVLEALFAGVGLKAGDRVCDIGAGVGHLTWPLVRYGCAVDAVEPNDAMRENGRKRLASLSQSPVNWFEGTGEATGRPSGAYDFVTFGSSFNVCDRPKALVETHRLLKSGKFFACMWNHRDLDDPIQAGIEAIIRERISDYGYGTRREDQRPVIEASGLFTDIYELSGRVSHKQSVEKVVEAWRSHGTLHRQAGEAFPAIIKAIEDFVSAQGKDILIPYTTRIWVARKKE